MKAIKKITASVLSIVAAAAYIGPYAAECGFKPVVYAATDEQFEIYDEKIVGDITYHIYKGEDSSRYAVVYKCAETALKAEIPSYIDGSTEDEKIPVTELANAAFDCCYELTEISIPETVAVIDSGAISYCISLERIILDENNPYFVFDEVLMDCEKTRVIKYPSMAEGDGKLPQLPDTVTVIDDNAFENCLSLTSVTIPDSVKKIDSYAFLGCRNMTELIIPEGVEEIGVAAFAEIPLLESVDLPESLNLLTLMAFSGSGCITEKEELPGAFFVDDWIADTSDDIACPSELVIPEGAKGIAVGTFLLQSDIVSVDFSLCEDTLEHINPIAFSGCSGIESVNFGAVRNIGKNAFKKCTALKEAVLPEELVLLDEDAFEGCDALERIAFMNPDSVIFDSATTIPETAIIACYENSTAHEYALRYGRETELLTPEEKTVCGDANLNGVVEVADAVFILQGIADPGNEEFALSDKAMAAADCYMPGSGIDSQDALAIQMNCAGIATLPVTE